jgi:flavodoxin
MKALVVYYSRTGTTKKVAEEISKGLKCDIEMITDNTKRGGFIGYIKCGFEGGRKRLAKINELKKKVSAYDIVIIGTPIWSWNMSSLARSFITKYGKECRQVALFCTEGGSGGEKAFAEMEKILGKKPVAELELKMVDVIKGNAKERIEGFVKKVKENLIK